MLTKKLATALSAAVLTAQLATSAIADDVRNTAHAPSLESFTARVSMDGIDPTTERGARALYRRIVLAAKQICWASLDELTGLRPTREIRQAEICFDGAVDRAVAELRTTADVDIEALAGIDRYAEARLSAVR
jgi:UrcA family protein